MTTGKMMDGQGNSSTVTLDLNIYFMQESLWPAILYTAVLMIVGTIGNILVLVVYRRHFQRSVTRMFIYALAILDLGNCLITMPAELTILIEFTSFPSPTWCRVTRYLTYIFNGTSSFILIAIALDRYFKVCRPMKILMTVRRAKLVCVSSFVITAIMAIPSLIIYGELKLPIEVSDDRVSILPLSERTTRLPSSQIPVVSLTTRPSHSTVKQQTTHTYTTSNTEDVNSAVVYGSFCLLNTEHVNGHIPVMFYVSMFILYIGMVVLVVFFYGRVARTMFTLTSKHSKMFSFRNYKACTPSSNSYVPEGSVGPAPGSDCKVKAEVSAADKKTNESSSASSCRIQVNEEGSRKHKSTTLHNQSFNSRNVRAATELSHQGNAVETGYETEDCSSLCDTKVGVLLVNQENSKTDDILSRNNWRFGNFNDLSEAQNCSQELNNTTRMKDVPPHRHSSSPHQKSSINKQCQDSTKQKDKKQKISKVPKIKIQKSAKSDNPKDSLEDVHVFEPLCTNSLLNRRIKSADNVNNMINLQVLRVPESRIRGLRFPNMRDVDHSQAAQKLSAHEKKSGSGTFDLDCLMDIDNPSLTQDKTCTLTKMSSNGKMRLYVLPLRGMTIKTVSSGREIQTTNEHNTLVSSDKCLDASQVRDYQTISNLQIGLTSSDKSLLTNSRSKVFKTDLDRSRNRTCKSGIFQCDYNLHLGHDLSKTKYFTNRSSPGDLNSPDPDSVVTLRNRTSNSAKNVSSHEDGDKTLDCQHIQFNVPRRKIISAADILEEQHRRGSLHPFRTSRMLFIISLVFVISFLPFFVIALVRSVVGVSFMYLGETELAVVSIFIRSSLISNAVNPIAYGLLSTHFRKECVGIIGCILRR